MRELNVEASLDKIEAVTDFVNAQLAALDCEEHTRIQVDVAIDELFGNIARYAYSPRTGPVTVRVGVEDEPRCLCVTFIDQGVPYNPLTAKFVDTTHLPAKQRPIGGLGLYMVKKTMDDISYAHRDGKNILTIRKRV